MLSSVSSATLLGVDGHPVRVEVHVSRGLPSFTVVGLPDAPCREARDRVRAAFASSGLEWPGHRITVNLAPSGKRKGGSGLDLAIAVGVLHANGDLPDDAVEGVGFLGELGLDGALRSVPGTLPLVDALDGEVAVVPVDAAAEAALVGRHRVRAVRHLCEVVSALRGAAPWPEHSVPRPSPSPPHHPDLADVRGQPVARRALEIAAAGGHHLLLVGPPGAGKSMLARRLPGILPALEREAALEVTRIHSAAGERLPPGGLVTHPPMRSPHHTATMVSLVGGGSSWLRPGEISLASGGVLFLDEMGEFPAAVLDSLRQPLEEGAVRVCRAQAAVSFPARFLLVGAMNPCPCGGAGGPGMCECSDLARQRYARRVSGPLLDRFDLRVNVERPTGAAVLELPPGECSQVVADRVRQARARAAERGVATNGALPDDELDRWAPLAPDGLRFLEDEMLAGRLSARGAQRLRRVALTIADLEGSPTLLGAEQLALAHALRARPSFRRHAH